MRLLRYHDWAIDWDRCAVIVVKRKDDEGSIGIETDCWGEFKVPCPIDIVDDVLAIIWDWLEGSSYPNILKIEDVISKCIKTDKGPKVEGTY